MVRALKSQGLDPFTVVESLRAALGRARSVLLSLAVDEASPALGLVELGRVSADAAMRLADGIRRGDPTT
jgi:hypothetical protein